MKSVLNISRCIVVAVLMLLVMCVISTLLIVMAALRDCLPFAKKPCSALLEKIALWWPYCNHLALRYGTAIEWQIIGREGVEKDKNYLILANHQSWADIPVVEEALYKVTGFSRYFIKKNLLHIPIIGWACKALHFPAMYRSNKTQLRNNPKLKGKDILNTKKSCQQLQGIHFKLINFAEGTRFSPVKKHSLQSPYQHLLKPKAAGLSIALQALQSQLASILHVTIHYSHTPSLWRVYSGQVQKITVYIEKESISEALLGDYEQDRAFRSHFQNWLNDTWHHKDQQLSRVTDHTA